jgi:hypothetical protein
LVDFDDEVSDDDEVLENGNKFYFFNFFIMKKSLTILA